VDDRALSSPMTHVLTIAIVTVLVSGLLVAAGSTLADQREHAAEEQLETIGHRLSLELATAERLAARGTGGTATLRADHVDRVTGRFYTVRLTDDPDACGGVEPCLVLQSSDPDARVAVPVRVDAAVTESTVPGGRVVVVHDGDAVRLEGAG
jgi:hypothetical protein